MLRCALARGRRYDFHSTNFAVPLRAEREGAPADVPRGLADTWAWIKWDYAGRPQRSTVRSGAGKHAALSRHTRQVQPAAPVP